MQQHTTSISIYKDSGIQSVLGSGGEDLLNRHTLALRIESILVQYGLPPKLDEEHTEILVLKYSSMEQKSSYNVDL